MNKYIKVNASNEITDVFFEWQKNKFDGTEILLEDTTIIRHSVNNKSISNDYGVYIFTWDGTMATEKTQTEIDDNPDFITDYKKQKKDQLFAYIASNLYDINRTLDQIRTQWTSFKTNAASWTTKQDVDDAYDQAIVWLHS